MFSQKLVGLNAHHLELTFDQPFKNMHSISRILEKSMSNHFEGLRIRLAEVDTKCVVGVKLAIVNIAEPFQLHVTHLTKY